MKSLSMAFVLFVNPFLFGRVFWGYDLFTVIFILISLFFLLKDNENYCLKITRNKLIIFLLLSYYFLYSSIIRIDAGQKIGDLIFHIYQYFTLIVLMILPVNEKNVKIFYKAILISLLFHTWTILPFLPFNDFLITRLSSLTAYSSGEYSIGILTRRATGFFVSPGYLSLFSSICFSLSAISVQRKFSFISFYILILSIVTGFSAFSRTFLVVFILTIFVLLFITDIKNKIIGFIIFICLLIYFMTTSLFQDYFLFVGERLLSSNDLSSNDRISGETGLIYTLEAIKQNFYFGSAVSIDGGDIKAQFNDKIIRPHFGLLAILSFYGIFVSSSLLVLMLYALYKSIKGFIFKQKYSFSVSPVYSAPFYYGYIISFLVCLVEPLSDTTLPLIMMTYTILLPFNKHIKRN